MVAHWAKPGVKVMCVHEKPDWKQVGLAHVFDWPRYRGIYTIRDIIEYRGLIGLRFDEIRNGAVLTRHGLPCEPAFGLRYFRPLVTRTQSQDIAEHFERFLTEPANIAPLDIPMLDEVGQ